jgi:transcriptional regulator with XRE-family HTH domain
MAKELRMSGSFTGDSTRALKRLLKTLQMEVAGCGDVLKELIAERGLTQAKLAEILNTTQTRVSRLLSNRSISMEDLLSVSAAINCDPIDVITEAHKRLLSDCRANMPGLKQFMQLPLDSQRIFGGGHSLNCEGKNEKLEELRYAAGRDGN